MISHMENPNMQQGKKCDCPHHKVVPVLTILFGLIFLLANWGVLTWSFVGWAWPVLVIIAGGTKLGENKCKCC